MNHPYRYSGLDNQHYQSQEEEQPGLIVASPQQQYAQPSHVRSYSDFQGVQDGHQGLISVHGSPHHSYRGTPEPGYPILSQQYGQQPRWSNTSQTTAHSPWLGSVVSHSNGEHMQLTDYSHGYAVAHSPDPHQGYAPVKAANAQVEPTIAEERTKYRKKICGLPLLVIVALIILLIVLIGAGLGVGLGLGLKKSSSSSSNGSIPSKTGAWNGTGLALGSTGAVTDVNGATEIFFQHHTGSIRYMVRATDGSWSGGGQDNIVATDALNGSPMSVIARGNGQSSTWYFVYINNQNKITQKIRTNTANTWSDGPLNLLEISPLNSSNIAFQLCDNEYLGPTAAEGTWGLSLLYASNAQTISQVDWTSDGDDTWSPTAPFTANGNAAVNCLDWQTTSVHYYSYFDLDNNLRIMWKDLDTAVLASATHPINQWTNASVSISGLVGSTQIGPNGYVVVQQTDQSLVGYQFDFDAEATSVGPQFTFGYKPITNTRIWLWDFEPTSTNGADDQLTAVVQLDGSDVTLLTRDMQSGNVSTYSLPIPDS